MSQFTFGNIDETTTDGFGLTTMLESFEAAMQSGNGGNSAPTYKIVGTIWRDTTADPNIIKMWDGSQWVPMGEISLSSHQFRPYFNGAVLKALGTLDIGNGLENSSGSLITKLNGSSLSVDGSGLRMALIGGITPGAYTSANLTVDQYGRITAIEDGSVTDEFTAGENIQVDDGRTFTGTNSYTNAHGVIVPKPGVVRVETTHTLGGSTAGFRNCNIRILVNGSEIVSWTTPSSTGTRTYNNDVTVNAGDQIRIQHKINLDVNAYISTTMNSMRIKTAEVPPVFTII